MLTPEQHRQQLAALLPEGLAWDSKNTPDSFYYRFLAGLAEEPTRVDEFLAEYLAELDPTQTEALLPEWEEYKGLPERCTGPLPTLEQRRLAVLTKLRGAPRTKEDFIALAATLGVTITITEHRPSVAGRLRAGEELFGPDAIFLWQVNGPATPITEFRAGASAAGDRLGAFGIPALECLFRKYKPAHTVVSFVYG